jgi:pimeloyl-ACP methyl ester carboxylesterase
MTVTSGYAPVNGLELYWESRGEGGTPLVVVHGGFGLAWMFGDLLDQLAEQRQVIALELQGHGHTADIDRAFSWLAFGDDIAATIRHLHLGQVDLMGYSLGGTSSLRAAIQHPELIRRLILVSIPCRRTGWFPEVLQGMAGVNSALFETMKQAPMYAAYEAVAPDVNAFPALMDKTGALLAQDYDSTDDVRALPMPTLLIYADADSHPTMHQAEFYGLIGGGQRDAGWDGSGNQANRLAILPGLSHYDIVTAPLLARVVETFVS